MLAIGGTSEQVPMNGCKLLTAVAPPSLEQQEFKDRGTSIDKVIWRAFSKIKKV